MQYQITLTIPVYKTAEFIENCLISVCRQTLKEFQIIIVDDCTPDNAMDIVHRVLENFPERKKHTKIISFQENQGISKVRKYALNIAEGKYLASLDSDDYLELNALESLLDAAKMNSSDIVFSDYYINTKKFEKIIKQEPSSTYVEIINDLLGDKLHGSLCNKIFSRELLNKVKILDNVNMSEDLLICIQSIFYAKNITYISLPLLHYIKYNENSYTTVFSSKKIEDMVLGIEFLENFFVENEVFDQFKDSLIFRKMIIKADALTYVNSIDRMRYVHLFDADLRGITFDSRLNLYKNFLFFLVNKELKIFISPLIKLRNLMHKLRNYFL